MISSLKNSALARTLLSAVAGFIVYGAWAYLVNSSHGDAAAMRAALTQASYSFVITMLLTGLMEQSYQRLASLPALWRYWLSTVPVCLLLYISSWAVNYLAGTPRILLTILPGAAISTLVVFTYVAGLRRLVR